VKPLRSGTFLALAIITIVSVTAMGCSYRRSSSGNEQLTLGIKAGPLDSTLDFSNIINWSGTNR